MTRDFIPVSRVDGADSLPWLILSNSLAADMSMWDGNIDFLTRNWRVLRYDTRGHGASAAPPPHAWTIDDLTADVVRLMDARGIDKAAFLGISLGGITGLSLAIHHADRIDRLVCCDARADAPPAYVAAWTERQALVREKGLGVIVEANLERWLNAAWRRDNPDGVARIRQMILGTSLEGWLGCVNGLTRFDLLPRLPQIRVPTLFVVGSEDSAMPVGMTRDMAASVPGARLEVIEGGAHLPNVDSARAFERAVAGFLGIPT